MFLVRILVGGLCGTREVETCTRYKRYAPCGRLSLLQTPAANYGWGWCIGLFIMLNGILHLSFGLGGGVYGQGITGWFI